jgi:chromosomal replication initiation ATPase DnaA
MDVIKDHVCNFYKINVAALEGARSGTRNLPKLIYIYLCKKKFGYPLHAIAQSIGFKSSGAVSVAVGRVKMMINDNTDLLREVDEVMEKIRVETLDVDVGLLGKF